MINNETIKIRSPHAIRPWQHVLEPLSGYLLLVERLYSDPSKYAEAWNFGPRESDCRPVSFLVEAISSGWGEPIKWEIAEESGPHEATFLKLECSKARSKLAWSPQYDITRAINETIAWYKNFKIGKQNIKNFTLAQIDSFLSPECDNS